MEKKPSHSFSFKKLWFDAVSNSSQIQEIPSIFPPNPIETKPPEDISSLETLLKCKIKSNSEVTPNQTLKSLQHRQLQNNETLLKLESERTSLIRAYQKYKHRQNRYEVDRAIHLSLLSTSEPSSEDLSYETLLQLGEDLGSVPTGLTSEEINSLPTKHVENETCSICLTTVDQGKFLPCLHIFHSECIDQWLRGKHTCPVCLKEV
jgi:hypothetical protein